jgi:arylsulfatase A-like enzyme
MERVVNWAMVVRLALFFWVTGHSSMQAAETQPNIVVVFIDDMGWSDFSCFGNQDARTPNIDRMAAEGIRFEQFYVNSPICSPSRCALTTGQYPQRWRISSYLDNRQTNERRGMAQCLDPAAVTLPRLLQKAGYATGHFGKWHLGGQRDVDDAPAITDYGFDESLTNFEGMGAKLLPMTLKPGDSQPGRIWQDAERLGGPVVWMQRSEITGGFVNAAVPFIKRATAAGKPFYINLWPDDVHSPYWPPVDHWGDGDRRSLYLSVLEEMDRQLGHLFDTIRDTPELRNNTLILICSDNGPDAGAGRAGPFRGTKATLFEGGIRSPLVVWGPGLMTQTAVGSTNSSSVLAAFDLVPSLLSMTGGTPPDAANFDGQDLSAVLLGRSTDSRSEPLYWRRPPDRKFVYGSGPLPDLAVREGDWKLLCDYDGTRPELYQLSNDPGESMNLAEQCPEIAAQLSAKAIRWHQSLPADNGPVLGKEGPPAVQKKKQNRKVRQK